MYKLNKLNEGQLFLNVNDDYWHVDVRLDVQDRYVIIYENGTKFYSTYFCNDGEYEELAPDYEVANYLSECINRDLITRV